MNVSKLQKSKRNIHNLTYAQIHNRIVKLKWDVKKALKTPLQKSGYYNGYNPHSFNGREYTLKELYKGHNPNNIPYNTLCVRLVRLKWDVEKALTTPNVKNFKKSS